MSKLIQIVKKYDFDGFLILFDNFVNLKKDWFIGLISVKIYRVKLITLIKESRNESFQNLVFRWSTCWL